MLQTIFVTWRGSRRSKKEVVSIMWFYMGLCWKSYSEITNIEFATRIQSKLIKRHSRRSSFQIIQYYLTYCIFLIYR